MVNKEGEQMRQLSRSTFYMLFFFAEFVFVNFYFINACEAKMTSQQIVAAKKAITINNKLVALNNELPNKEKEMERLIERMSNIEALHSQVSRRYEYIIRYRTEKGVPKISRDLYNSVYRNENSNEIRTAHRMFQKYSYNPTLPQRTLKLGTLMKALEVQAQQIDNEMKNIDAWFQYYNKIVQVFQKKIQQAGGIANVKKVQRSIAARGNVTHGKQKQNTTTNKPNTGQARSKNGGRRTNNNPGGLLGVPGLDTK
jgi:hypothetical protein